MSQSAALTTCEESSEIDAKFSIRDLHSRGVIISFVFIILNQFCGVMMLTYSAQVFERTGSQMTPLKASACLAIVLLSGIIIAISCVNIFDRDFLFFSFGLRSEPASDTLHAIYKDQLQDYGWLPVGTTA